MMEAAATAAAVEQLQRGLPAAEAKHEASLQAAGRVITTAAPPPAAAGQWRCRVCQVECGGRDVFRAHCASDEHFAGLQAFVLGPDLFAGRLHVG